MSLAPSLKNRVKRLEAAVIATSTLDDAEVMRRARARRHAFTPLEAAVSHCAHVEAELAALNNPSAPSDHGVLGIRYRGGKGHLKAMAALSAPDIPEPPPCGNVGTAYWAWSGQQFLRSQARRFLDALALIAASDPAEVAAVKAAEAAWNAS